MENLLRKVYESRNLSLALRIVSHASAALSVPVFMLLCYRAFTVSLPSLIKLLVILGAPFLLVTLLRRVINAPRPYEMYAFFEKTPKNKSGSSFPSRHAFSIFAIGSAALFVYPIIGSALLLLGVCLCVCRVLLGIHFVRDVLAGALIGALASIAGIFIASPF